MRAGTIVTISETGRQPISEDPGIKLEGVTLDPAAARIGQSPGDTAKSETAG